MKKICDVSFAVQYIKLLKIANICRKLLNIAVYLLMHVIWITVSQLHILWVIYTDRIYIFQFTVIDALDLGKVVSDSMLKKKYPPLTGLSMPHLHLAYQRKGFDGIYCLFTECRSHQAWKHYNCCCKLFFRRDNAFWMVSTVFFGDYFTPLVPCYISLFLIIEEICFMKYNMLTTEVVFIFHT